MGALDGVHFAMISPSNKDVPDAGRYHVARKDEYALLCIAVCAAARRILSYDISQVPTTHDSLAWSLSGVGTPPPKEPPPWSHPMEPPQWSPPMSTPPL